MVDPGTRGAPRKEATVLEARFEATRGIFEETSSFPGFSRRKIPSLFRRIFNVHAGVAGRASSRTLWRCGFAAVKVSPGITREATRASFPYLSQPNFPSLFRAPQPSVAVRNGVERLLGLFASGGERDRSCVNFVRTSLQLSISHMCSGSPDSFQ